MASSQAALPHSRAANIYAMPVELDQMVFGYLEPSDQHYLKLTCQKWYISGPALKEDTAFCQACEAAHPKSEFTPAMTIQNGKASTCVGRQGRIDVIPGIRLDYERIKVFVETCNSVPNPGPSLRPLLAGEIKSYQHGQFTKVKMPARYSGQVDKEGFVGKAQAIFTKKADGRVTVRSIFELIGPTMVLSPRRSRNAREFQVPRLLHRWNFYVCGHMDIETFDNNVDDLVQRDFRQGAPTSWQMGGWSCRTCFSDIEIHVQCCKNAGGIRKDALGKLWVKVVRELGDFTGNPDREFIRSVRNLPDIPRYGSGWWKGTLSEDTTALPTPVVAPPAVPPAAPTTTTTALPAANNP